MRGIARILIIFLSLTDVWLCTFPLVSTLLHWDDFEGHGFLFFVCLIMCLFVVLLAVKSYQDSAIYE